MIYENWLGSRSSHEIGRGQRDYQGRGLFLELERNGDGRGVGGDISPPSDNVLFDNQCYATTPSSSNGNSDLDQPSHHRRGMTTINSKHVFILLLLSHTKRY